MFLRVSPTRGVMKNEKMLKLSSRFVRLTRFVSAMVKYIMLFVLVKPTNEEKKIIQAYSFSC